MIFCNICISNCQRLFNVFHYYIKEKGKICKAKHVQGITLAHLY